MSDIIVKTTGLCADFKIKDRMVRAVNRVSLSLERGKTLVILGESGSGKSTLLNCISCYIPFEKGNIKLGGQTLANLNDDELSKIRNEKLGFVFQDFMLLDGLTVFENVCIPK